jgi:thymidylate synthase (FAD)
MAKPPQLRKQDKKNRQNSTDNLEEEVKKIYELRIHNLYQDSYRLYEDMIAAGVAKECARDVLPLAAPTKLYMNGTIRSWLHYCDLRTANGTQREHAQIAAQVQDLLYQFLPNVSEAMWNKND